MSQDLATQIQTITQVVQAIVVIVSLLLLAYQIKQQTDAIRLQTLSVVTDNLNQMAERFDKMLDSDPELADFYDNSKLPTRASTDYNALTPKERKYYMALGRALSYLEAAYSLWAKSWLGTSDYRAIMTMLREIMGLHTFSTWWPVLKDYYGADFVAYLDKLIPYQADSKAFYLRAMSK